MGDQLFVDLCIVMDRNSFLTCSQKQQRMDEMETYQCTQSAAPKRSKLAYLTRLLTLWHGHGFHCMRTPRWTFGHLEKILQNKTESPKSANSHLFCHKKLSLTNLSILEQRFPPRHHQHLSDGHCQAVLKSLSSLLDPHGCFSFASRTYQILSKTKE